MKNQLILLLFFPVLFSSCTHYYYVPNTQNVPLFRGKNEYRLSGSLAGGEESSCKELQAAYSVTDHIGIMANFMSAKGGNISDNEDWGKGNYLDAAIGYFKPIKEFSVFEIYGGIGGSNQRHQYSSGYSTTSSTSGGFSDLSFTKIFVQPSIGFTFNAFDIAASTRICVLSFKSVVNQINGNVDESNTLNNISGESHFFLEPAITIRGGWKYVKLQLQASTASYFNDPTLHFEAYHLCIGLQIAIAKRYKRMLPYK
jgi:hypothetical protein